MNELVEGTVTRITCKQLRNSNEIYSIAVDIGAEKDEWFGYGFDKPRFNEGAVIEFEIEEGNGGYWNVVKGSTKVITDAPVPRRESRGDRGGRTSRGSRGEASDNGRSNSNSRSANTGSSAGNSNSVPKAPAKAVDWDRKDNLIRLQSSQNTAVATINMMLTHNLLAIPKKKGEAFDIILEAVEDEAARLFSKYTDIVDGNYEARPTPESKGDDYDDGGDIPD